MIYELLVPTYFDDYSENYLCELTDIEFEGTNGGMTPTTLFIVGVGVGIYLCKTGYV